MWDISSIRGHELFSMALVAAIPRPHIGDGLLGEASFHVHIRKIICPVVQTPNKVGDTTVANLVEKGLELYKLQMEHLTQFCAEGGTKTIGNQREYVCGR